MGCIKAQRQCANSKRVYGGIIDYILNKRDIEGSKYFFQDNVRELLKGNVDINELIISKSLRANYANPTLIPHKVLADRMGERDLGINHNQMREFNIVI